MTDQVEIETAAGGADLRVLGTSRRAIMLTVVFFFAGLNACSYFLRTDYAWRRLTGETAGVFVETSDLLIGFPLAVAFTPGHGLLGGDQWLAFAGNVLCALVVAWAYAIYFGKSSESAEQDVATLSRRRWSFRLQFRLIHLMAITTVVAILLGLFARAPQPSLRALKLIYLGGPCLIVWVFYALRSWPTLRPLLLLAILASVAVAAAKFAEEIFGDFSFGLFGMFICWMPQLLLMIAVIFVTQNLTTQWRGLDRGD